MTLNKFILITSILLSGCLAIFFGKELCWDLANYHFYNPYALLHARHKIDYWPNSNVHQYINPTIDLLTYFLIQNFTPRMSEFILGAIHGINLWLLFLIAKYFLPQKSSTLLAVILALLGMLGPTTLPGIGSFQNDNLISIFVLGFVLLQLQGYFFFAGVMLGLGLGLKLTAGIYAAGGMLAILFTPLSLRSKIKMMMTCGTGFAIGMLITSGYWMWMMWSEHHNPLFPFFNSLFHSPDFAMTDWRDTRFLPKNLLQTIFFPFYFSFDGRTADAPFRDFRFAVVYGLVVMIGAKLGKKAFPRWGKAFLLSFFLLSYLIWQFYFSIARYLAPLEMLAPLMIYLLLRMLMKHTLTFYTSLSAIFLALMLTLSPIPMIRAPWYDTTFFNVQLPASLPDQATVLIAYPAYVLNTNPRPQSYLIPFFPAKWRFIGIPLLNEKLFLDAAAMNIIQSKLNQRTEKMYLLTSDRNMPELLKAAFNFHLAPDGECEKIYSDRQAVTHQNVLLCPIVQTQA
jgi:hypothetical protein